MRIVQLTPSFFPAWVYGGPSRSVFELSCALGSCGALVRVVTTNANGHGNLPVQLGRDVALADGVTARYCRRVALNSVSPQLLRELAPALRWADVIHLQGLYSYPTMFALSGARLYRKPLVWSPRGAFANWSGTRRPKLKRLWRAACLALKPRSVTLHATSEHERRDIQALWPQAAAVVVPNGVRLPSAALIEQPARSPEQPLQLLFLGRLAPIKGLEQLLSACAILAQLGALDFRLTIAGTGDPAYERQLRQRVTRLGLQRRVAFVGLVAGTARQKCFQHAHLTVVPSHREAFSMVVAESLAHGVPVIASRQTPWQQLDERRCGRWVVNDPRAIAASISSLSTNDLRKMGARGRRWMHDDFNWKDVAHRMMTVYHEANAR